MSSEERYAKKQPFVTAAEAIIWIAHKKWLTYEALQLELYKQEDIFWGSPFATYTVRHDRAAKKRFSFDIGKQRMLAFAQRLAEGGIWEEQEWCTTCGASSTGIKAMEKCLRTTLEDYNLSLPAFIIRLQLSIAYEKEQTEKLTTAEQELLDAACAEKIVIYGQLKNGIGDLETIPTGFLLRDDITFDIARNELDAPAHLHPSAGTPSPHSVRESIIASALRKPQPHGWTNLKVKRADIEKLWPDNLLPDGLSMGNRDHNVPSLTHCWATDFSTTLKVSQDIAIAGTDPKNVAKFNIYQDHAANTKFIGFYIPASDDTYQLCIHFSEVYERLMGEAGKTVMVFAKQAGDLSSTASSELSFSGRIYIYHETELSLEQLAELTALYRTKKLHVQFRGRSYATTCWLQERVQQVENKTFKAPPQEESKPSKKASASREKRATYKNKSFKGKPGPKTKYPDAAYIEMRDLIDSKGATSIREAARKVAPKYKGQSVESTVGRLAQTYRSRIQEIVG